MIKVTLPNGIVVEGDSAVEVGSMIDQLHADPEPEVVIAPVVRIKGNQANALSNHTYPHKLSDRKCGIKIGGREEQVLRVAKMIAEVNESRATELRVSEICDLIGDTNSSTVGSALNGLHHKGLVTHGSHNRIWVITRKGWDSKLWVTQPIRSES